MHYSSIDVQTWRSPAFMKLTRDEKLLLIYLMTCPSLTICGIYTLPIRIAAMESGIRLAQVPKHLEALESKGHIKWDAESECVWVKEYFPSQLSHQKFELGQAQSTAPVNSPQSLSLPVDKRLTALKKLCKENPGFPFWESFIEHNKGSLGAHAETLKKCCGIVVPNPTGQTKSSQAPSKPL